MKDNSTASGGASSMTAAQEREAVVRWLREMDDWCIKRCAKLREKMDPHIMAGGSLDDPQYRCQLGEHRAYMAMRSYIHGTHIMEKSDGETANDR